MGVYFVPDLGDYEGNLGVLLGLFEVHLGVILGLFFRLFESHWGSFEET